MRDWLPLSDAVQRYGVSRATLYRLIAAGRVKYGKRAGDSRTFVSSQDVKEATTIRAVVQDRRLPPRSNRGPRRSR